MNPTGSDRCTTLSGRATILVVLLAATAFHVAFIGPAFSFAIVVYVAGLIELTRTASARRAFYSGFVLGLLVFAPKLSFFFTIFNAAAIPLWAVLAFWHALFVLLGCRARASFSRPIALALIPVIWTACEYFRSELYWLRFSWLAPSFAFPPNTAVHWLGSYGATAGLMFLLIAVKSARARRYALAAILLVAMMGLAAQPNTVAS